MTRRALGLMQGMVFISPSQEEILEATPGWDDVPQQQAGKIIDETPSQPHDTDLDIDISNGLSPLERVFDVSGSTLSDPTQEAVEFVSPPTPEEEEEEEAEALSPRAVRDDSLYNEAFESDRSQSPSRRLSWGIGADAHGSCKDAAALEEMEGPLETRLMIDEATTSDGGEMVRSSQPGSPLAFRAMEPSLEGGEVEGAAFPRPIEEASPRGNNQLEDLQTAAAALPATSASPEVGGTVSTRIPPHLPLDNEGVERSPSVAAQDNFESRNGPRIKRNGEACSSAGSDDNPATVKAKAGSMVEVSAPPTAVNSDKSLTLNVWGNSFEDNFETGGRAFSKLMDDGLSRDGNQGRNSEAEPIPIPIPTSGLQDDTAAGERRGIDTSSSMNRSERVEATQTRPVAPVGGLVVGMVGMVDVAETISAADNFEVKTGIAEDGGKEQKQQQEARPPPAVQEKLDRLRSQKGKRVCTEKSTTDIIDEGRFRQLPSQREQQRHHSPPRSPPAVQEKLGSQSGKRACTEKLTSNTTNGSRFCQPPSLPDAVMSAIKFRSGGGLPGPGLNATVPELLKIAVNQGSRFPAPLDKMLLP